MISWKIVLFICVYIKGRVDEPNSLLKQYLPLLDPAGIGTILLYNETINTGQLHLMIRIVFVFIRDIYLKYKKQLALVIRQYLFPINKTRFAVNSELPYGWGIILKDG